MCPNTNQYSITKKLIRKIRSARIRLSQYFTRLYVRLVNICVTTLTDKYWLIDYLPKKKAGWNALLLVRLDLIGDFIIWLDAAKEFRTLYPDKRIVLYANAAWATLADHLPYWDEVVNVDMARLRGDDIYRLKLLYTTRIRGFDIAIQPTYSREYAVDLIIRASNAHQRIGHIGDLNNISSENKAITDAWYTQLVPQGIFPEVELNINAELIRALGNKNFMSRIPSLTKLVDLTIELEIKRPYCVMMPGASWAPRMWTVENFAEVARELHARHGLSIVLCGTASETELCDKIAQLACIDVISLAGQTTLIQMVEVIRHARLLIANESASVHIATATQTSAVCIVGGGHFGRFLPYQPEILDDDEHLPLLVFNRMDCYGCRWRCHYPLTAGETVPCISGVTVAQVMNACQLFCDG